jgi:hypothetical protein
MQEEEWRREDLEKKMMSADFFKTPVWGFSIFSCIFRGLNPYSLISSIFSVRKFLSII